MTQEDSSASAEPLQPLKVSAELAVLQNWMKERGVTIIEVTFDGYSDNGSAEVLDIHPKQDPGVQIAGKDLHSFVAKLAVAILDRHFFGWEDNDGSAGNIVIRPDAAELEFGTRNMFMQEREAVELHGNPLAPELAVLQSWMKQHGIPEVEIGLDGYGDTGRATVTNVQPDWPATGIDGDNLAPFIDRLGCTLADKLYPGWENNFGGNGTLVVKPGSAVISLGYYDEDFKVRDPIRLEAEPAPAAGEAPSP